MCMSNETRESQSQNNRNKSKIQEVKQDLKVEELSTLFQREGVGTEAISGNGYTYRHDWGNRNGELRLTLNSSNINCNTRVFVSATEFGGGQQCGFTGDAKYTVHNVSPFQGGVTVWVSILWDSAIRLRLTYLIINP